MAAAGLPTGGGSLANKKIMQTEKEHRKQNAKAHCGDNGCLLRPYAVHTRHTSSCRHSRHSRHHCICIIASNASLAKASTLPAGPMPASADSSSVAAAAFRPCTLFCRGQAGGREGKGGEGREGAG